MTHDIHLSFDNLALHTTGIQVKRGDYDAHTLNFVFDDIGADSYRVRIKNPNCEKAESDFLYEPVYTLGAFDVATRGIVLGELSAYSEGKRLTSATFSFEVVGDISTDNLVSGDDRIPALDSLIRRVDETFARYPEPDKVPTLVGGKLIPEQMPSISINDVFTVSDMEELTSLDAQRGDVAVFTYESSSVSTEKPESMVKNTILVNQSIDGSESTDSLRDEGISFSVMPTSITATVGRDAWGKTMDGIYFEGSSSPRITYTNVLSGDYTVNVSTKIDINQMRYYINYADASNYYMVSLDYNGVLKAVTKVINGASYTLNATGSQGAVNFHSRACNTEINVENLSGGGLKITLTSADNDVTHAKCSYEIIDDGKLCGEAITKGYFAFSPSYCKMMSVYLLKIVKHEEYGANLATRLRDTYILASDDATKAENWVKIGISYVEYSGNSAFAENAKSAHTINGHRLIEMSEAEFENAVKDPNAYYLVY